MTQESKSNEVALQLLKLGVNDALDALSKLPLPSRKAVLDCVAAVLDASAGGTDDRRITGVWLLRENGLECAERIRETLGRMALSRLEPDSIRVLCLDSIETLWLAGGASASFVENLWAQLRDDPSLEVRCRWLRVLAEAGTTWSLSQLSEALEIRELLLCILSVLSNCRSPLAAPMFEQLARGVTEGQRDCVNEARQRYELTRAKAQVDASQEAYSDEDAKLLVSAGEFALLHKLVLCGRLSAGILVLLRDLPVPGEVSKSQRRFLRKIKEYFSPSTPDA